MASEQRNAICGKKATSPANGFHVDTATKALLYLTDVHKENGPFTMLRDYPVVTNKWGFRSRNPTRRRCRFAQVRWRRRAHTSYGTPRSTSSPWFSAPAHGPSRFMPLAVQSSCSTTRISTWASPL
jgi:hypothetical protein